jgi:hypothetical protein
MGDEVHLLLDVEATQTVKQENLLYPVKCKY